MTPIKLSYGAHEKREDGMCLLEVAAYLAGEEHTDHPACVSPVLGAFGRALNDALDGAKRQELLPLATRMARTADDGRDQERGLMAAAWLIKDYVPAWLDLAGIDSDFSRNSVDTWQQVEDIVPLLRKAQAAGAAAWDAAGAAAGAAAGDAAWAAAGAAARDAARAAARDAARAAARDAAGAAARDALRPTVISLQDSAIQLFIRMIDAGRLEA